MEARVCAFTSGQGFFAHLKEIDKWRVDSEKNIRLKRRNAFCTIKSVKLRIYGNVYLALSPGSPYATRNSTCI